MIKIKKIKQHNNDTIYQENSKENNQKEAFNNKDSNNSLNNFEKNPSQNNTFQNNDVQKNAFQCEDCEKYKIQIEELTNTLKRLQAEFENYKKRVEKENQIFIKNSNANLIKELLPVLDSFELAIKNNNSCSEEYFKFKKGLELIYAQFFSILENFGLRVIETKNAKFDPYKHEVLMIKESDLEDDLILEEFQKGYMLNDYVLRHSKVMIAKHISKESK